MVRERWREVPDCPGYEVSSFGRVRNSAGRLHGYRENRAGWLVVSVLGFCVGGYKRKRVFEVHRLVAEVFRGIDGPVGHLDGDYRNNAASNLVPCCSEREAKRMSGRLRYRSGSASPLAKLSPGKVRRMRAMREKGWTIEELGARFGVAHQLVSRICSGKAWREA